jgi:hypothetical protein
MVLRHERKAKRATIKRAIELRRLQLLFTWLGGGEAADGEQNVLGTTCPFCEVPAGTPCRTSGGFAYSYTFHMDRFWSTAEILGLRREDFDEIFANDPEQHKLARALELLRRS